MLFVCYLHCVMAMITEDVQLNEKSGTFVAPSAGGAGLSAAAAAAAKCT